MNRVYIFGHKNPDTDSVTAAISLAYLKQKQGVDAQARVLGQLNAETIYALSKFGVEAPKYLNDVKAQIRDVEFNRNYIINENAPIIDAFNFMSLNSITGLPIVDDCQKFKGYVSLKEIAADMIYNESMHVSTLFDNLLKVLDAKSLNRVDEIIDGHAHTAAFDDAAFVENVSLDSDSILIVGNRKPIVEYALQIGIKMIVLINSGELSEEHLKLAQDKGVNVISSSKSSFEVVRVLCLSDPIKSIRRNEKVVTLSVNDYLSDARDVVAKMKHTNYAVFDSDGVCAGMLRTMDLNKVNRKKVILVDHNTTSQSIDGLDEADVVGIVDHHNLGDIVTSVPINVRAMAVGSTNTIIYQIYNENDVAIPRDIAGLMLSGILSDTLCLKSPTTTQFDVEAASVLAKLAGVDVCEYGMELLSSGVSIEGLSADDIIFKDCKKYKVNGKKISISQIFTTNFEDYVPRIDELVYEMEKEVKRHNLSVCSLFVTDFFTHNSYLIYSKSSENVLKEAYGLTELHQGYVLEGVVSRKKQILPLIMDVLDN